MSTAREILNALKLGYRVEPRMSVLAALLLPCAMANTVLAALGQRWLVNSANAAIPWEAVFGAALAALGLGVSGSLTRVVTNLRNHLAHESGRALAREAFVLVARRRDHELLSDSAYADDVEILRKHALTLGNLAWTGILLAGQAVSIALSLALLVSVHPALGLTALLVLLPIGLAMWTQNRIRSADENLTNRLRQERELHAACTESERVGEPRTYGALPRLDSYASRVWEEVSVRRARVRLWGALVTIAGWVVFGAGLVLGLTVLADQLRAGAATLGDVILVITLITGVRLQISHSLFEIEAVAEGISAAHAMSRVRAASVPTDPTGPGLPSQLRDGITIDNVSFDYANGVHALHDVDLTIPAGSVVAVVGLNGAGKSTLVDLLTGTLRPTSGRILLDGNDLSTMDLDHGPRRLSGAFQDFLRPPVLAGESVGIGDLDHLHDEPAVWRAIDRADAGSVFDALPEGLRTPLSLQDGASLSHGQWQKLAIARSAMNDAPLIIALDEPTSALDPQAEHDLFTHYVQRARDVTARQGTITLLVSHRLSSARLVDRVLSIENGRVAEYGTHEQLMNHNGRYRQLFEDQQAAYS
ncbi:ABC transporter ATP-binding protein/permease [Nocardia sp. NBC_01377]|uniref:ATP-binding cassette domain-containing protein n=1 Tax=Nocardia sp. NBC_01377 TaxID=2903595 RepID=UPI0032490A47